MLASTSWTTYSHRDKFVAEGEFGPVSYEQDTEMQIGLKEEFQNYDYILKNVMKMIDAMIQNLTKNSNF